jgi:hypothetical protein
VVNALEWLEVEVALDGSSIASAMSAAADGRPPGGRQSRGHQDTRRTKAAAKRTKKGGRSRAD